MFRVLFLLILTSLAERSFADDTSLQPDALDFDVLAAKREGAYYTGVPALAFSPDSGFIYGVLLFRFDNGERPNERFNYTPYLNKTNLLAVQSTKGLNQFKLNGDIPFVGGSLYRVYPEIKYTKNISEQYFGVDEATLSGLKYPELLRDELDDANPDSFSAYQKELQSRRNDGSTFYRYNHYLHEELEVALRAERAFFSKNFIVQSGFRIRDVDIVDYSGKDVVAIEDGEETTGTMATTKLAADSDDGLLVAANGAVINKLEFNVRYDTRDFEPDPKRGIVASLSTQTSREEWGSSESYSLYKLQIKGYVSPTQSLTFAGRTSYSYAEGMTPFFDLPSLGGRESLKGFRDSRFRSVAASLANAEVRWRSFALGEGTTQSFVFTPIGFVDWGRVYDDVFRLSGDLWNRGSGLGLRIVWNQATVIAFEYALSGEDQSLYVNINHVF